MSRGGGVFIAAAAVAASVVEGSFAGAGAVGDGRGQSACVLPGHTSYPFCNTSLSVDERVTDLIGRIRDEDKPNLLTARGCRNCNKEEAKVSLKTPGQQQALPYLGVPAYYWGTNCIHSAQMHNCTEDGRCVTSFPSGTALAATFDQALIRQVGGVVSTEVRAAFNARNWIDDGANGVGLDCWSPVINLNRDPRWGRNGEGGAEDPKLMADVGVAWTEGMQQGEDKRFVKVAVTLKHFVANAVEGSWNLDGTWSPDGPINRHTIDVNLSRHILADYYYRPFKESIRAGAKGVMCAYNSVNGEPVCLSANMKAARDAWGFDGYVTSDSDSVADAYNTHHFSSNLTAATVSALSEGGCDIDSGDTYYQNIPSALEEGLLSKEDVDRALFNSMRLRFDLGLFDPIDDQPYWKLGLEDIATNESTKINQRAAQASLVLLQNPGGDRAVLPLEAQRSHIAVVGPHANATHALIEANTGRVCPTKDSSTEEVDFDCVETPFEAIRRLNGPNRTSFASGASIADPFDVDEVPAAVDVAKSADVVVLGLGIANCGGYLGDKSYALSSCGLTTPYAKYVEAEAHDRPLLDLPPAQQTLAKEVIALGKPTVVFLLNGGMVALPDFILEATHVAVVEAFYPGKEGADAIAQAIFGNTNSWGRLPYTVYTSDWVNGTLPDGSLRHNMLDHDVAVTKSTYRYLDPDETKVQFPFGFGLSLSEFELSLSTSSNGHRTELEQESTPVIFTNGSGPALSLPVSVANRGARSGDVVVQLFVEPPAQLLHDHGGKVKAATVPMAPRRFLATYQRVSDIVAGHSATVRMSLNAQDFLLATADGDLVCAPGIYHLSVETGAPGETTSLDVELKGDTVVFEKFPLPSKQ